MKYYLGLTTYNRPEFLGTTLETLFNSDLNLAKKLVIFDDKSNNQVIDLLNKYIKNSPIECQLNINKNNLGVNLNIMAMNIEVFKYDDFCVCLDSDSRFAKNWLNELEDLHNTLNKNQVNWGAITVYNSMGHKTINTLNDDKYIEKKDIGSFAALYRKDVFFKTIESNDIISEHVSFDWKYSWYCNQNNLKLISTKNSFVQHIGAAGCNSFGVNADKGENFVE